jgi:hypothetical protein
MSQVRALVAEQHNLDRPEWAVLNYVYRRQGSNAGAAWLRGRVVRIFSRKLRLTEPINLLAEHRKKKVESLR